MQSLRSPLAATRPDAPALAWSAAGLAGLVVISLLPIVLTDIPAMVDYPNHLARMSVLARAGTPLAHPDYLVTWAPYSNLAMDLVVPAVSGLVGVELATKLFYLTSQLLIVSGAMALSLASRGRILGAGLVACLFLYAMPFAFGFMNFAFALGIALWAIAAWIRSADAVLPVRLGLHAAAVALLFFAHLFALGLYGFAIGVIELWRLHTRRGRDVGRTAVLFAGMALPVLLIALAAGSAGGKVGGSFTEWKLVSKTYWLLMLNGFDTRLSLPPTFLLLALTVFLVLSRSVRLVSAGAWLLTAFGLLYLAMPVKLFDTGFVDGRVLLALVLILPAFVEVTLDDVRHRRRVVGAMAAAAIVNVAAVGWVQASYRADYHALIEAFSLMPRGARMLIAETGEADDPPEDLLHYPMHHAGTLAVHVRDAFVPTLFTYPGKQPIRPRPELERITLLEGGPIPLDLLAAFAAGAAPPDRLGYVRDWTRNFDYLLLLRPESGDPLPELLAPIVSSRRFKLYRIGPGSGASTGR